MILNMNRSEFLVELKEQVCLSDWLKQYYTKRSRKYCRIDYWMKCILGLTGALGAIFAANEELRTLGVLMAGISALVIGTILPNFKWDSIVDGLEEEEEEWTRIFHGYEAVLRMSTMLDKDEILTLEYQEANTLKRAAELNDRKLPEDQKLLDEMEQSVRKFYKLDPEPPPINPA